MPFCLDVQGKILCFYACWDEWVSAVNPSCKPHQRKRGQRNRRGLSNKGIITLCATLSGSGHCWGRPVPAVGWASSRADKKRHPTWAEASWSFQLRGYVPPPISEWILNAACEKPKIVFLIIKLFIVRSGSLKHCGRNQPFTWLN